MCLCRHNLLTMNRQRVLLLTQSLMEFIVGPGHDNLKDRIALLGHDTTETPAERQASLRLLRHLPSSVHHEQYHYIEYVTVCVDIPDSHSNPKT